MNSAWISRDGFRVRGSTFVPSKLFCAWENVKTVLSSVVAWR